MAKNLLKLSFFTFLFLGAFILFFPMKNLYFFVEEHLKKEHRLVISNESYKQIPYSFNVLKGDIYEGDQKKAKADNITFKYFLLYNSLEFNNIKLEKQFVKLPISSMKINSLKLEYSIKDILHIDISSMGEFGSLTGEVDLLEKEIKLFLKPSSVMRSKGSRVLQKMKNQKGVYSYVYKY